MEASEQNTQELSIIHSVFSLLLGANVSSVCADDPATNCYQLSKLLSICSDIPHAKNVCRKYCGLCSLGMYGFVAAVGVIKALRFEAKRRTFLRWQ